MTHSSVSDAQSGVAYSTVATSVWIDQANHVVAIQLYCCFGHHGDERCAVLRGADIVVGEQIVAVGPPVSAVPLAPVSEAAFAKAPANARQADAAKTSAPIFQSPGLPIRGWRRCRRSRRARPRPGQASMRSSRRELKSSYRCTPESF
jgi:hypothetical protein